MNVFEIFRQINRVPFAVSRDNWSDRYYAVITSIEPDPDTNYGKAYGFSVKDHAPDDHMSYDNGWKKRMELPNVGSYQWRLRDDISVEKLEELKESFYKTIAPRYGFKKPINPVKSEQEMEDDWFNSMS